MYTINKINNGLQFFNEAICEKVRNKNFNLKAFARQYYLIRKEMAMKLAMQIKGKL